MDIVTQGLLGASLAQSAAVRNTRIATGVGFAAGLLPDADSLIRSSSDPLLFLEFHRHFSHALVFIPVGAALATLLLWPFLRGRLSLARLYLYALLGYALAGVLDACTSYGTHLFWPFSPTPVAWSIVSIFDPLFSLVLLIAVAIGLYRQRTTAARVGLLLAGAYLLFGAWQNARVEAVARDVPAERGHQAERIVVKPTIGNLLLWRSLYVENGIAYVDAVRASPAGETRVYPGQSAPLIDPEDELRSAQNRLRERDVMRFAAFSDSLMIRHPERPAMLGDARFAMLPTLLRPLWGIEPGAEGSTEYVTDRSLSEDERQLFIDMLLDRP